MITLWIPANSHNRTESGPLMRPEKTANRREKISPSLEVLIMSIQVDSVAIMCFMLHSVQSLLVPFTNLTYS